MPTSATALDAWSLALEVAGAGCAALVLLIVIGGGIDVAMGVWERWRRG